MQKKIKVCFAVMCLAVSLQAQVYIQTTLPSVGLVQKNQLWNIVLVNGTTASIEGKLELVLRDRQSGIELMTATSNAFILPKGSLSINSNSLNPIQYNYLAMQPGVFLNNLLPAGTYLACYSFSRGAGAKRDQLGEECVAFDIEPLSPPMLVYPADSAVLENIPVQFSWTPPTPVGMMRRLTYEIAIAEITPGQRPAEAIQHNMSFYNSANKIENFLLYGASLPAFEKEKWYSWQITARDDNNYAGKSEVWVFKIKNESETEFIVKGAPFLKMKTGTTEQGIAPEGILKISYFNRSADSSAIINITNISEQDKNAKPASVNVKISPGENQLQVNLKKVMAIREGDLYRAELVTEKGEKSHVLFTIKYFDKE